MNTKNMVRKARKGFTLVELLFVMAIIAILAGIAFANLSGTNRAAYITSIKSDAKNAISAAQAYYSENQAYPDASCDATTGGSAETTGLCTAADTGTVALNVSPGNLVDITDGCADGSAGFEVRVENENLTDKIVTFDSCTNGHLQLVAQ